MTYLFAHRRYRLPFRAPLRTAHGVWKEREGVLVRLEGNDGRIGWGEASPIPEFGTETISEVAAACEALGNQIDSSVLSVLPTNLGCLQVAVAAALQECRGAEPDPALPYLPVAALLPAGRPALAAAASKAEMGFRVFKWKVGVADLKDELSLLDDVCAALPSGAKIRLDANGAWDRRAAERWLERCADRPVEFVEQPIDAKARGADDLLLGLARDYPTPLALDESLIGAGDIARWLTAGWSGVFVVKPSLLGGVDDALARLGAAGALVVFSSALETAVGARIALRAAFSWSGPALALGFGVWPLFADSRFDGPAANPFLHWDEVKRIQPEDLWNAMS